MTSSNGLDAYPLQAFQNRRTGDPAPGLRRPHCALEKSGPSLHTSRSQTRNGIPTFSFNCAEATPPAEAVRARRQTPPPADPIQTFERLNRQNAQPGSFEVTTETTTLADPARGNREIGMQLYLPKETNGQPAPLVMLSHGLGGSEGTLGYLAEHLTSQGYAVAALRHPGADVDAVNQNESATFERILAQQGVREPLVDRLKADDGRISESEFVQTMRRKGMVDEDIVKARQDAFQQAADDLVYHHPQQWADRPQDVSFAIDELQRRAQEDPAFAAKIDFTRIAAGGHSYGSYTSLALAGASVNMPEGMTRFRDPRIQAAFILSPIGVKDGMGPFTTDSFKSVETPVFGLAGSEEDPDFRSMPVRLGPEDRHDGYMMILDNRYHDSFGNHGDAKTHEIVEGAATTFLNAALNQTPQDMEALNNLPLGNSTYLDKNPFFRR